MKLLTRMIAFLSFFVMVNYGYAAGNSIYIDQIGDGSNISLTQTGSGNGIGTPTTRSSFNGNNNTVTVSQIGNQNNQLINVVGDGVTLNSTITGNTNQVDIDCSGCTASSITSSVTGSSNLVTITNDGLNNTALTIDSDNNTVNLTNNSTSIGGVNNVINISGGNGNQVSLDQTGPAGALGHKVDLAVTGALNNVQIGQGGSVDSVVNSTINGSSNTLIIKSNHN
jgi:hypothetical protein